MLCYSILQQIMISFISLLFYYRAFVRGRVPLWSRAISYVLTTKTKEITLPPSDISSVDGLYYDYNKTIISQPYNPMIFPCRLDYEGQHRKAEQNKDLR